MSAPRAPADARVVGKEFLPQPYLTSTDGPSAVASGLNRQEQTLKLRRFVMSTVRTVPRPEWRSFFDRMSKALLGKWAEIEVATLDLGDQIVAEWVPMIGITYDSRDDLLDVALDRSNHLIRHPVEIVVEEDSTGLRSVAVVDGDGARQIVTLKSPIMLPPVEVHH
jgi:hypothetical protein